MGKKSTNKRKLVNFNSKKVCIIDKNKRLRFIDAKE